MRKSSRTPAPTASAPASSGKAHEIVNIYHKRPSSGDPEHLGIVLRDETGAVTIRRARPDHACFFRKSEITPSLYAEIANNRFVSGIVDEGDHWRVRWRESLRASALRRLVDKDGFFASVGVEVLEADVDPVRRYITDHPEVEIAKPRRCFFDIEADSRVGLANKEQARVLSWAIANDAGEIVASRVLDADDDEGERRLLEAFWDAADAFDQLVAWNGGELHNREIGYDFPVLVARTRKCRLKINFDRWLFLDQMRVFQRNNIGAESGDEKQSAALAAVAMSLGLGGKTEGVDGSKTWELWLSDPAKLLEYNEQDARLQALIEKKNGHCDLVLALCRLTSTFPDTKGLAPTRQVEGFLMRLAAARGMRFATKYFAEEAEKYAGAYVQEPTCEGITRNVHVCDFSGMYPNNIRTFNLSPETVRGRLKEGEPIPEGCAVVPLTNVVVAQEPRGILPTALDEAMALRAFWSKKKAAATPGTPEAIEAGRMDAACKAFVNSFYGVMGTVYSRFYLRDVAESTSLAGVWLIKQVIAAAEARGWKVVYGDTDSAFVVGPTEEEFAEFVAWCNAEFFPRILKERGCARNFVLLAYEKEFEAIVMNGKKRYAGKFRHFKGKRATAESKLEVKGLEYRRGDTLRLARHLQIEIVEAILKRGEIDPAAHEARLDAWKSRVLNDALDIDDVRLVRRMTKPIEEYVIRKKKDGENAAQETHVEIARILQQRGREIRQGDRIEFVVVDGSETPLKAIPVEDRDPGKEGAREDRFYLWENLIYPPARAVLESAFPGRDWSEWERVRPPKPRRRGRAVPKEQAAFDFLNPTTESKTKNEIEDPATLIRIAEGVARREAVKTAAMIRDAAVVIVARECTEEKAGGQVDGLTVERAAALIGVDPETIEAEVRKERARIAAELERNPVVVAARSIVAMEADARLQNAVPASIADATIILGRLGFSGEQLREEIERQRLL